MKPVKEWEKERKRKAELNKDKMVEKKVVGNMKNDGNNSKYGKQNGMIGKVEQDRTKITKGGKENLILPLEISLRKKENCREWTKITRKIIEQWRLGEDTKYNKRCNVELWEEEIVDGKYIGWKKVTKERVSNEWRRIQKDYSKWLGIRRTGERWLEEIKKKKRNIAWDRWQYKNDVLQVSI